MKYVTVIVTDSAGNPLPQVRVAIFICQFAASGMKEAEYTNSAGEADFRLDVDTNAEIEIYVDGNVAVPRGPIRGEYIVRR